MVGSCGNKMFPFQWHIFRSNVQYLEMYIYCSGQIKTRPHTTDFPQKVANRKGNPLISGISRLVKYYKLARLLLMTQYRLLFTPSINMDQRHIHWVLPTSLLLRQVENGPTYTGQWSGSKREGHGTLFFDKGVFEGQWIQGNAHGKGIVHFKMLGWFKGLFSGDRQGWGPPGPTWAPVMVNPNKKSPI